LGFELGRSGTNTSRFSERRVCRRASAKHPGDA